jgi:predicted dehydrogenase
MFEGSTPHALRGQSAVAPWGAGYRGQVPSVVLLGWGTWSQQHWSPILTNLARWQLVELTIVDRWPMAPAALHPLVEEGVLRYSSWDDCNVVIPTCEAAYVVTDAKAHLPVIQRLVEVGHHLRLIVCEKPCGESLTHVSEAIQACQRRGILLLIADHYLLRPPVQHLLQHPALLDALGGILRITATMTETKAAGPAQGVLADMATHLVNLLLALMPGSECVFNTAALARAAYQPHTIEETYAIAMGHLYRPGYPPISCVLECGKQLPEDRKALLFVGTTGTLQLDLLANTLTLSSRTSHGKEVFRQWHPSWSYAHLILQTLAWLGSMPGRCPPIGCS